MALQRESQRLVVFGTDMRGVDALDDVLYQVNGALAPINAHVAVFLAPFSPTVFRHAKIVRTQRAS